MLPAINAAIRTARNAAVPAEINQLAQALASFKSQVRRLSAQPGPAGGERELLDFIGSTPRSPRSTRPRRAPATSPSASSRQRSLTAFRKFWPEGRVQHHRVAAADSAAQFWYDFNGNGVMDTSRLHPPRPRVPGLLPGRRSRSPTRDAGTFGMTGFGKDPTNPFTNSIDRQRRCTTPTGSRRLRVQRRPAVPRPQQLVERRDLRAFPATTTRSATRRRSAPAPPSTSTPTSAPTATATTTPTTSTSPRPTRTGDGADRAPVLRELPDSSSSAAPVLAISPAPNPYTSTLTAGTDQRDGHVPEAADVPDHLAGDRRALRRRRPVRQRDHARRRPSRCRSTRRHIHRARRHVEPTPAIRQREHDNLTNFKSGTLQ